MTPPFVRKFIAGSDFETAFEATQGTRESGVETMFNRLGEHHTKPEQVDTDVKEYARIIDELSGQEVVSVSLKPSQVGLDCSEADFQSNLDQLSETAAEHDVKLWVDMEDSSTTEETIEAVCSVDRADELGLCLQANLLRTPEDIDQVLDAGVDVRLVKGAYTEESGIAFQSSAEVDEQYKRLCDQLIESDQWFAVASHDPEMIQYVQSRVDSPESMEFQMLKGVREQRQVELVADGWNVTQYVPYGPEWKKYFWRRLREGKRNFAFIARAFLSERLNALLS